MTVPVRGAAAAGGAEAASGEGWVGVDSEGATKGAAGATGAGSAGAVEGAGGVGAAGGTGAAGVAALLEECTC